MKRESTHRELVVWAIAWALVVFVIIEAFASCSVVHKVLHREKEKTDSVYSDSFKRDSAGSKDSNVTHIDKQTTQTEITLDFDTAIYVPIHDTDYKDWGIYLQPDDSKTFEIKPDGSVKTTQRLRRVTIKGSTLNLDSLTASFSDHSQIKEEEVRQGEVTKVEKKVDQLKDKKPSLVSYLWWLLLLIAAYLIYRNRDKVKAVGGKVWSVIIHLITGL